MAITISIWAGRFFKKTKKQNKPMLTNIPVNESDIHVLHLPSFLTARAFFCLFCPQQGDISFILLITSNVPLIADPESDCCPDDIILPYPKIQ
jgi:hypothetical protein